MQSCKSSSSSVIHSFSILTYHLTYRNRDWAKASFFYSRREEKRNISLSFSLHSSLFLIDNKNEEEEKKQEREREREKRRERRRRRRRFVIFLSSFTLSLLLTHMYLLICSLLLFYYNEYLWGFFVQVYDRLAYVKSTWISLHASDQRQIRTYILWHDRKTLYISKNV